MTFKDNNYWAIILGGSSGFGLATAKKLASEGVNICVAHRDRRGSMEKIEPHFEEIRKTGVKFLPFNLNALTEEGRNEVLDNLQKELSGGTVRLLLHSIALGNLKLIAPEKKDNKKSASDILAEKLGVDANKIREISNELFADGNDEFIHLTDATEYNNDTFIEDEDMANTIYYMGTNLLTWTMDVYKRKMFADNARVIGLTSEGNEIAWKGYAAVSAAKVAMESVSRSIACELGPHGIRSNILQPGVTDTPALRLIPGSKHMIATSRMRNPLGRLTTPEDVADAIYLMCRDEASWINGNIIRVDGGERISG
ncbi:MAG: SDR family oxidoreductase [Spirochaetia bacterium]|nr:SDR family oxidoreductase [Spirochaetia bacterium]